MTIEGAFIADGPSDLPLASHLELLCRDEFEADVVLARIDPSRLRAAGRTVEARLRFLVEQDVSPELVFVHRDAEQQDPELRYDEVSKASRCVEIGCPVVPVVPVTMTEAWLLLDERAIREVAGRPTGRKQIGLPKVKQVERLRDPKQRLKEVLLTASESTGRHRKRFERDFGRHRTHLLERLDPSGPVNELQAWKRLREEIRKATDKL